MADVFSTLDAQNLLAGKIIYMFGDSNMRALYKDIVCLLVNNQLIRNVDLKAKVENSFMGDTLTYATALSKGRDFREDRLFKGQSVHVEYHFVTKCYNDDIEKIMLKVKDHRLPTPDILIMNSALWDCFRWGCKGVDLYKDSMHRLMRLFRTCLPSSTLVLWVTVPPIAGRPYGGFLIKQVEFMKYTLRFEMMEANMYAQQVVSSYGYDVLDFHYHLRMLVHHRCADGIHWSPKAMRHLTNLVLTHVSFAWGVQLPGNYLTNLLERYINQNSSGEQESPVKFPIIPAAFAPAPAPPPLLPDPYPRSRITYQADVMGQSGDDRPWRQITGQLYQSFETDNTDFRGPIRHRGSYYGRHHPY